MFLGKIRQNVEATLQRLSVDTTTTGVEYRISVPFDLTEDNEDVQQEYYDAAYAAGLKNTKLLNSSECYGAAYERKFPSTTKIVLVVDMGHSTTTVSLLRMGNTNSEEEEDTTKKEDSCYTILKSTTNTSLGAGLIDINLWNHFSSTQKKNSRKGQRLLAGCKKLKHLLSQLPEGSVMVENVNDNDGDLQLKLTRSSYVTICKEVKNNLIQFITEGANLEGDDNQITSVEVLGGGCRIPWVQDAILEAVNKSTTTDITTLSHGLDDTSMALGAALIGEQQQKQKIATTMEDLAALIGEQQKTTKEEGDDDVEMEEAESEAPDTTTAKNDTTTTIPNNDERRKRLLEQEKNMAASDEEMRLKADIRNKIESRVLEIRSAKHNIKYGHLIPATIDTYLNESDDWLFSEDCDNATLEQMQVKYNSFLQKTEQDLCKDYYAAVKKDNLDKERLMEEEAAQAQLERNAEGDGDEEDHDNRRLPKKRRMEIVLKNKTEANELFSDGNYKFAAARYTKALSHCYKFVDLSPDDQKEVNAVKLSVNLNLALSYMKLQNPNQALRVCNDALGIDENSVKALYRRASVHYELKKYDLAKADVQKAMKNLEEGTTDKAITKLNDRIAIMIKRQKAKEKKMAQKMFG